MTVNNEFLKAAVKEVTLTRMYEAPSSLVFEAWTDPVFLQRWCAPRGGTAVFETFDFRRGGTFCTCIRSHGDERWCHGVFLEIVVPERIVFATTIVDANGNPLTPAETMITVTFAACEGNRSKLTLHQVAGCADWPEVLDRLAGELAKAWIVNA